MSSKNILFFLELQAHKNPNKVALVYESNSITYKKLFSLAMNAGAFFKARGVNAGDVVALSFRSEFLFALSILGLASLDATTLCISITNTRIQKHSYAEQAKCNKFFSDEELKIDHDDPWDIIKISDIVNFPCEKFSYVESPTAYLMLAIGSGSTGLKKLMPISHQVMIERCETVLGDPVISPQSRLLCMSGLAFISVANRLFNSIYYGVTFVLLNSNIDDIFGFIKENSVTTLVVSVFHLEDLLRKPRTDSHEYFKKNINAVRCVGSLLSEDLKKRVFRDLNENIINSYATNETGVISRTSLPAYFDGLPNVGTPLPRIKVEVVDNQDMVLAAGKRGHIRISTQGSVEKYLYNELATQKAFRGDWFYPGDVGEFLSNGSLLFHGRSDRMMIFNGINIFPVEIEQTMTSHPSILDCIAFPLKNKVSQDIPVCAISLKANSKLSEDELIYWAQERLGVSCPKRIFILQELPKTIEGKIQLQEVVEIVKTMFKK